MHPFFYLVAILSLSAFVFTETQKSKEEIIISGNLAAVATNLLTYRNAVARYALINPSASGVIPDASLGLPAWYRKHGAIGNYVSAGRSYSFYSGGDMPGLAGEIYARTESTAVGTNASGVLTTPARGNTGIALPAQVPNQAVVILQ